MSDPGTYLEHEVRLIVHAVVDIITEGDTSAQEVEDVLNDQLEMRSDPGFRGRLDGILADNAEALDLLKKNGD